MIVQVNQYIQGLCPTLHLADNKLKHPEKKLKSGNEVKCRVSKSRVEKCGVWVVQGGMLPCSSGFIGGLVSLTGPLVESDCNTKRFIWLCN